MEVQVLSRAQNMSAILVRPFEMSDLEGVKTLRLKSLRSDPQAFRASYEEENKRTLSEWRDRFMRTQGEDPSAAIFVAVNQGQIVGMVTANKKEANKWKISAVYVDPDCRRRGIGSGLLSKTIKSLREKGEHKEIELDVNAEQMYAVRLYEKFGFETTSRDAMKMGDGLNHEKLHMRLK